MKIAALCIGDELLDGRVRDANSAEIAHQLTRRGLRLSETRVVPDHLAQITSALAQLAELHDLVIVTGGLGPTDDDLTRHAAAALIDDELSLDEIALERLKARIQRRGYTYTPNNKIQAMFPSTSAVIYSEVGTAAGFSITAHDAPIYFLPGVPREARWYVSEHLTAWLEAAGYSVNLPSRRRFELFGVGESGLATMLAEHEKDARDAGVKIGWRANYPSLELTLEAPDEDAVDELARAIEAHASHYIVARGDEDFFARVGRMLVEHSATVTAAESCTAGMLAAALTQTPGSSAWLDRSWVTYANDAKHELVGVSQDILDRHGAVSAQTVAQMAAGAAKAANATYGLAISGIAGPGGGTPTKPVGTVHFGLSTPEGVWHRKVELIGRNRDQIRQASVYIALSSLLWTLEGSITERPMRGPFSLDQVWSKDGIPSA